MKIITPGTCLAALVCTIALAAAAGAQTARSATYDIDIPAESLRDALQTLALAVHHKLLYSSELVEGKGSPALKGTFTAEEALKKLLDGTHLSYQVTADGLVLIRAAGGSRNSSMTGGQAPGRFAELNPANVQRTSDTPAEPGPRPTAVIADSAGEGTLEEVVVTGSHIRGVRNDSSPMLTIDRQYIDRSGFTNMQELVESLPIDFKGGGSGSSETAAFGNTSTSQNLTRGTGFNLRGLGSVSTLTLINGRRVAPSAQGQFVDVSNIPLEAVDRVEILTDGASAIYGADAVAGVVNIILRKNFNGAQTAATYGQATSGGTKEGRLSQTFGTSWSSGDTLVIADLHQRDPLDARDRPYIAAAGGAPANGPTYLLPDRTAGTLLFNLDQTLPGGFDFSTNILYSHERVIQNQTYDDGTYYTNHPVTNQESGVATLGYMPFGDWRFEFDASIARVETVTDFTYSDIATGDVFLLVNDYRDRFDTWEGDLRGDGSLFSLPAGNVRLAAGASYRKDRVNSTRDRVLPPLGFYVRARDKRGVTSAYGELFIPFVSRAQDIPGARRIDMSVAARFDDYSDFGSTINPKVGLVWTPFDMLDLRATYGTSFRAPSVAEKSLFTRGIQISTDDSFQAPGGGTVPIFYLLGSTPLTAEKAKTFSVGFTLKPLAQGEITFNWYNIDYTDRISSPPYEQDALLHRAAFGDLITDLPSDAAAQAYLNQHLAEGDLFIDFVGNGAQNVRYAIDLRQQNAARTRTNGFDLTATYPVKIKDDSIDLNFAVARINKILDSLTATTTPLNQVNTFEQPLKTRVRAMATWIHGGFNTTVALNFSNSYTDNEVFPNVPVSSWTTTDLNVGYNFEHFSGSFLRGCKAAVSVSNLFNRQPPLAPDPFFMMGFDVYNADALGRYVSVRLTKRW
jgi:outer membrane receptor protein involved in Fe transport